MRRRDYTGLCVALIFGMGLGVVRGPTFSSVDVVEVPILPCPCNTRRGDGGHVSFQLHPFQYDVD